MNGEVIFSTDKILMALQRVAEERLTGGLSVPYKTIHAVLACENGALTGIDAATADTFYLPFLQANVTVFEPPPIISGEWYPLLPDKSLTEAAMRYLCRYLSRMFEPDLNPKFTFQAFAGDPPGFPPLGVPALVCRFLGTELSPATLGAMQWDLNRRIQVVPDLIERVRDSAVPLTPQQAYMLSRLRDGLSLHEFSVSYGVTEEQAQRAMLIFSFFRLTRKDESKDPFGRILAPAGRAPGETAPAALSEIGGGVEPRRERNGETAPSPIDANRREENAQNAPAEGPDPQSEKLAREYFAKGKEAYKNKKFQDAADFFQEAAHLAPHISACHFMWGKALALNPLMQKRAEEVLLKAVELTPRQVEYHVELARLYEKMGLPHRARTFWEQTQALDPKNREAADRLAADNQRPSGMKGLLKMDLKDLFRSAKKKA